MIIFYALIAIFISWIWIDYFILISFDNKENLWYYLLTYVLGGASVLIVFGIEDLLKNVPFELNGNFLNDFLYSVFRIGLIEEVAKLIPFLLVYFIFRKRFFEPLDYIAFICMSALGFATVENTLYFREYGAAVINSRAILSTVGHMFDAAIIAYGLVIVKYKNNKNQFLTISIFFFLGVLSHGFYDFWLLYEGTKAGGWIITILYFLVTISVLSSLLNNTINNSSKFSYKNFIDSTRVAKRLLINYIIVFAAKSIIIAYTMNLAIAIAGFFGAIDLAGIIIIISVVRLSRFKLIKGRWQKIKIELPFAFTPNSDLIGYATSPVLIRIKGDSYNEAYINAYFEEHFALFPVSSQRGEIEENQPAYIEKKLFLKNDETFYLAKFFTNPEQTTFEMKLLKPKTNGNTAMYDKYPIVAIIKFDNDSQLDNPESTSKDFEFQEWAYIKKIEPVTE